MRGMENLSPHDLDEVEKFIEFLQTIQAGPKGLASVDPERLRAWYDADPENVSYLGMKRLEDDSVVSASSAPAEPAEP